MFTRFAAVTLLSALLALPAFGSVIREGAYEVKVQTGNAIPDNDDSGKVRIQGGMGYFVADNVLVGGFVSYQKLTWDSYWGVGPLWGIGGYAQYHFDVADSLLPFVGFSAGLFDSDNESDNILIAGPAVGLKYLINDQMAISCQLELRWASDGVFDFDRDPTDSRRSDGAEKVHGSGDDVGAAAVIGLRFFY